MIATSSFTAGVQSAADALSDPFEPSGTLELRDCTVDRRGSEGGVGATQDSDQVVRGEGDTHRICRPHDGPSLGGHAPRWKDAILVIVRRPCLHLDSVLLRVRIILSKDTPVFGMATIRS